METHYLEIIRELDSDLSRMTEVSDDVSEQREYAIGLCKIALSRMRKLVIEKGFPDVKSEINFFKKVKPLAYSKLLYYQTIFDIESKRKKAEIPVIQRYFQQRLFKIQEYMEEHQLKGGQITERELIWHYPHYGNQGGDPSSIIRRGDWKLIHYYEDDHEELYNLKTDLSEATDVSAKNPENVNRLHTELFDYLKKVDARFPKKDPEYNAQSEKEYEQNIVNKLWPSLENQRKEMLSNDFNPKNNWWGSQVTKD